MTETENFINVDFGKYNGPTTERFHNRDIADFDNEFHIAQRPLVESKHIIGGSKNKPKYDNEPWMFETFDSLLAVQLNKAVALGKNEVVLLDIGSGDGGIFDDFTRNSSSAITSRKILEEHPQLAVKMIGLSDSKSPGQHLHFKETHSIINGTNPDQVIALNYFYSLTKKQNLQGFLDHIGIIGLDLVLGTYSFEYLSGPIFRDTVETAIKNLTHGSRMVVIGFGNLPPGFVAGIDSTASLNFSGECEDKNGIKKWLRNPYGLFQDRSADLDETMGSFKRVVEKMRRFAIHAGKNNSGRSLGWNAEDLKPKVIDRRIKEIGSISDETTRRYELGQFAQERINMAMLDLYLARRGLEETRRIKILEELSAKYQEQIDLRFSRDYIDVLKI